MSGTEALESLVSRHVISGAALGTTALVARAAGQPLKPLQGPAVNLKIKGLQLNPAGDGGSGGSSGAVMRSNSGPISVVESAAIEALRGPLTGSAATAVFDGSSLGQAAVGSAAAKGGNSRASLGDSDGSVGLAIPADPVVYVAGARIIRLDILAGPSVVHVIDRVLLVPEAAGILSVKTDAMTSDDFLADTQPKTSSGHCRRFSLWGLSATGCGLLIMLGYIA